MAAMSALLYTLPWLEMWRENLSMFITPVYCATAHKDFGHGKAEAVYTLLDIANGKQVPLVTRNRGKEHILRFVGVLIFVQ